MTEPNRPYRGLLTIIFLSIVSLLAALFIEPFIALFRSTTPRYKYLAQLEIGDLCKELVNSDDLSFKERNTDMASDHELAKIAYHISVQSTKGLSESVPELRSLYENPAFWVYRNSYTEKEKSFGIRVGFYLATIIAVAIYLF